MGEVESVQKRPQNAHLVGDVLNGVKKVQKNRNFPSVSYTTRVLLREYLTQIGVLEVEEEEA